MGKKHQDRPRLLIITLDNPACKHDILRGAPQLRNSGKYDKICITPDLTLKEREAGRKLREELASRRRAGEENVAIRGGKIIHTTGQERAGVVHVSQDRYSRAAAQLTAVPSGSNHQAPAVLSSGSRVNQSTAGTSQGGSASAALSDGGEQADRAPAVLGSGGGAHQSAGAQGDRTSAALGGGRGEQPSSDRQPTAKLGEQI